METAVEWYSLLEVAERLRIPMASARRLALAGAFPGCLKIGKGTFRIRADRFEAWLEAADGKAAER